MSPSMPQQAQSTVTGVEGSAFNPFPTTAKYTHQPAAILDFYKIFYFAKKYKYFQGKRLSSPRRRIMKWFQAIKGNKKWFCSK